MPVPAECLPPEGSHGWPNENVEEPDFLAGAQKVAAWTGRFPSERRHGLPGVGSADEAHRMSDMTGERRSVGERGPRRHGWLEGIVPREAPVSSTGPSGHGRVRTLQPEAPGLGLQDDGVTVHTVARGRLAGLGTGWEVHDGTRRHGAHGGPPLRHRAGSPSSRPESRLKTSDWPCWMAMGQRAATDCWPSNGRFVRSWDQGSGIFTARRSTLACMSGSQRRERMPSKVLRAASQFCEAT